MTTIPAITPGTHSTFAALKQIEAGVLEVGYAEDGPAAGPPVILLHGWPYDIHSYLDVAPALAAAGYRVIVPYLRGYGTTRFLSDDTARNAQQAALAVDTVALMDALGIRQAILGGFDWGARSADVVAALWPERTRALVSVSGYLIGSQAANKMPLPPQWAFDDATFARSAASFQNPDHVAIVIHNYRWRLGLAAGEPQYDDLEVRLAESPLIAVPTVTLEGDANGAPHPEASAYAMKFSGPYEHRVITGGIGHNLPQEAPQAFAEAILNVATF